MLLPTCGVNMHDVDMIARFATSSHEDASSSAVTLRITRQLERPGEVDPPLLAQQLNKATSSRDAAAIYLAKMLLPIPCATMAFQKLLALPRF